MKALPQKTMRRKKAWPLIILSSAWVSMMIAAAPPTAASSLKDILEAREDLSVFTQALKQSPLWKRLGSDAELTIFVPSNVGLREEGSSSLLEQVLVTEQNTSRLRDRLALHIAPGANLEPADIASQVELNTLAATCMPIRKSSDSIRVGPEAVVAEHISAEDGSLYVIDRLLWRPWDGSDHCRADALRSESE